MEVIISLGVGIIKHRQVAINPPAEVASLPVAAIKPQVVDTRLLAEEIKLKGEVTKLQVVVAIKPPAEVASLLVAAIKPQVVDTRLLAEEIKLPVAGTKLQVMAIPVQVVDISQKLELLNPFNQSLNELWSKQSVIP